MPQQTTDKIEQFISRKASQYPRLDLQNTVSTEDRLNRFL